MNLVSDIELPPFDYTAPDFSAGRYHQQVLESTTAWAPTWPGPNSKRRWRSSRRAPATSPWTGPRSRAASREFYGIDKLPIIWPGSSQLNPNRGPEPYVS
jgi:hypothetical protein